MAGFGELLLNREIQTSCSRHRTLAERDSLGGTMSTEFTIALSWPASSEALDRYRSYVTSSRVVGPKEGDPESLIEAVRNADVIAGGYVPAFLIHNAKRLKMVQVTHAGAIASRPMEPDHDQVYLGFSLNLLRERGILMGNIHGNAVLVAEHAVALLLALGKKLNQVDRVVSGGGWFPFVEENRSITIQGSTVGIVGLGSIGQEVARRIRPFGARILATKKHPDAELARKLELDFLGGHEDLPRILQESDFVVLTTPLTRETDHFIGERELRMMKPTACLVNVARGDLVQEVSLYRALTENWISGFASDVWWFYDCRPTSEDFLNIGYFCPVPSRLGVHKLDNVLVTSDRACFTNTMEADYMKDALENADMLARGETPRNLVDLDILY